MQATAKRRTLFTLREVSERWGVSTDSIKRWIRANSLDAVRIGGRQFVPAPAVERAERKGLQAHE